jgi:hypothetical protein
LWVGAFDHRFPADFLDAGDIADSRPMFMPLARGGALLPRSINSILRRSQKAFMECLGA